jgi:UMF1 family MFS transporter|tara:strand:- start:5786 stop:7063 length:1278 start_codon:yes stop_codon:yes gene_type:complete
MKMGLLTKNRKVFIWCLFDWANSPYPTVILTFVFSAYFTKLVAEDEISGTFLWSQTIAFSGLFMAVIAPILGAISDETGKKKIWILVFSILAILATMNLWFVLPDKKSVPLALIAIAISLIAFEFCTIFYNATLIQVANSSSIGKVSGLGWAAGYIGAIICLLICLFGLVERNFSFLRLDIDQSEHIRATTIVVGLWWFIFSLPFFIFFKEGKEAAHFSSRHILEGLKRLFTTIKNIKHYRPIMLFLLARMFYADGLLVVFQFGGIYAAGTFGMTFSEILKFGIAMNIFAGLGAFVFAWVEDWLTSKTTIFISLIGLVAFGSALLFVETQSYFWAFGLGLSFFIGPAQSASRAFLARLSPKQLHGEMYGLFAMSGKATSFIGPMLFGWLTILFETQRAGMFVAVAFWLMGIIVLVFVKPTVKTKF